MTVSFNKCINVFNDFDIMNMCFSVDTHFFNFIYLWPQNAIIIFTSKSIMKQAVATAQNNSMIVEDDQ